ncbi:carbohydrate kinase family protein [Candidatus Kaiserbacteria bacterium CG10_big_fil_rev_8_21_14_0_10_56_12]|uniref:Carbohydrate kinase family protein n=1 Tax=Candidatus Kaiserbacteria bacterium CG10_big_fil_rev_8_21_14_0_10_56_12 TaxID=1974611 RepID=A0A2H0UA00_9BACT|nr:MAG: carbohydrate kinase family protein [Candidatus Kaiserbacteria bacterium CG10_big_fil_rev_8_21_14_0_10_56_12]
MLSSAGSDFARYSAHLRDTGIDTESIQISSDTPTASAYIITDQDDNQIAAFSSGAGDRAYTMAIDPHSFALAIASPGCLDDMVAMPRLFRESGVPFFYDPWQRIPTLSREQLIDGITGAEAVFVNDYEMKLIEERTGLDEKTLLEKTEALVITLGAEGSRIITHEGAKEVAPAVVADAIDPTGAGDAYRAGFLKGRLASLSLEACGKLGGVSAAYAVEKYGTQNHTFTLDEFRLRYTRAHGEDCPI